MRSVISYSLAFVAIILTTSLAVLGQVDDPCTIKFNSCHDCVTTKTNTTIGNCVFVEEATGPKCVTNATIDPTTNLIATNPEACNKLPNTTTPAPPTPTTTSTTPAPTTTNATTTPTPAPTTTNGTTTTTTAAPSTTNGTTTVAPTPTTNGTTPAPGPTTSTPAPANVTTTAKPSPPSPRKGGFAWGEFIGGIVFAIALSSVAYLIWRFYKARLDRNYHTFSNPTF